MLQIFALIYTRGGKWAGWPVEHARPTWRPVRHVQPAWQLEPGSHRPAACLGPCVPSTTHIIFFKILPFIVVGGSFCNFFLYITLPTAIKVAVGGFCKKIVNFALYNQNSHLGLQIFFKKYFASLYK